MSARTHLRLAALGAAFVVAVCGAAHARGHGARETRGAGASGFGERHGSPIRFSASGHERFASHREIGYFGSAHAGRFHFGGQSFASSGHSGGHSSGGYIQCVQFARADTGIELTGNASAWWDNAAGIYQRGGRPESGAVLNFRANGAMRMGHVAVVNHVVDSRTIYVDHANWGGPGAVRGGVSRGISVVDVSPSNDWSAVRVALGHSGEYGSIYPTYGFIYNRPDGGTMMAANDASAPIPAMNAAPRDLRGRTAMAAAAPSFGFDEVAEAPDSAEPRGAYRYGRRHVASHGYQGMRAARTSYVGYNVGHGSRHASVATQAHRRSHHI